MIASVNYVFYVGMYIRMRQFLKEKIVINNEYALRYAVAIKFAYI